MSAQVPGVLAVISVYNGDEHLREAIHSILGRLFADFELVIVGDGSTDATVEVVTRYVPRVTLIRQQNAGSGAARNRGFELATGDYVVVDADDVWAQDKLERQILAVDRDLDTGLCYTNGSSIRVDGSIIEITLVESHKRLTCLMAMTGRNPIVTSYVLISSKIP